MGKYNRWLHSVASLKKLQLIRKIRINESQNEKRDFNWNYPEF